ncbi:MAG: MATE family efflux transporter [Clostridia bacterium]|nr:MATE family efflux transporter [Clostridia bacterium]
MNVQKNTIPETYGKSSGKAKSEKMGVMPVGKLIFVMSVPAMISMLVQALYNVVDSMFVSAIGGVEAERALDAVSIAFPFQLLNMAFALGIAVGANSLIARHLGEGDGYSASKVASTGMVVSLAHCVVFMILGATAVRPVARLFTSDGQTVDMVVSYLSVCLIFSFGLYVEVFVNKVNQAMSRMTIPMISQLIGAITNIILDPVFIFVFGLGVTGAAVATVTGQIFAMIFTVIVYAVKKSEVSILPKYVRMKGRTIASIYKIGLPTIILNAIGSFTIMTMNGILSFFKSKYGITILGVYFKVQSFVFMPCFGLNQGILPILAYNYGANKKDRFDKTFRIALTVALIIMAVGFVLFQTVSGYILSAFGSISANAEMHAQAVSAFRIISVSFLPAALSVITITMFQSIGRGVSSMLMAVLRQVGVLIPAALVLCVLYGVNAVWWAYPIAEIAVIAVFFPIALKTIAKVFAIKAAFAKKEITDAA